MSFSLTQAEENPQGDNTPARRETQPNLANILTLAILVEQNAWTLYKYDFIKYQKGEAILDVIELKVSTEKQLIALLQQNKSYHSPARHTRCNYCFFRRSITPIWQDPLNRAGGRILIQFYSALRITSDMLHEYWGNVLKLVMKRFRFSPYITGVEVYWWPSSKHAISIWTSRIFLPNEISLMTEILKGIIINNFSIEFHPHIVILRHMQRFQHRFRSTAVSSTITKHSSGSTEDKKIRSSVDSTPGPSSTVTKHSSGPTEPKKTESSADPTPSPSRLVPKYFSGPTKPKKIWTNAVSNPCLSSTAFKATSSPTKPKRTWTNAVSTPCLSSSNATMASSGLTKPKKIWCQSNADLTFGPTEPKKPRSSTDLTSGTSSTVAKSSPGTKLYQFWSNAVSNLSGNQIGHSSRSIELIKNLTSDNSTPGPSNTNVEQRSSGSLIERIITDLIN